MIQPGKIVLLDFPKADSNDYQLRPVLVLKKTPGRFDDWLVCMISSQLAQHIPGFGEIINLRDTDFVSSGLKNSSVIRLDRLLTTNKSRFKAELGEIAPSRLHDILETLIHWLRT